MRRLAYLLVLAIAAGAGGCTLHFGGDDTGDDVGDDTCTPPPGAPQEQRNPETLQCESFGGGECLPGCPCPLLQDVPVPTWGVCGSSCEALDPTACELTAGCRAIYDDFCYTHDALCPLPDPFLGCYPTDQQGPIEGGGCAGLDSWSCSMHDDCIALHTETCSGGTCWQQFIECVDEPPPPCGADGAPPCG